MIVKLIQAWMGQPIGAEVDVSSYSANLLIVQGIATIVDANDNSGVKKISVELVRPANTTSYAAGDAILQSEVAVKQKETLTLSGTFGAAVISGAGGLTRTVTFTTDLTTSAANFVAAYAADYLTAGITLTSSGADIIFEAATAGVPIIPPAIANLTSSLTGTVYHTVANVAAVKQKETLTLAGGRGTMVITGIVATPKTVTFTTDLTTSAANFVTANAADYLTNGVVMTAVGSTLIFEANVAGIAFVVPTLSFIVSDLAGTVAHTTANRAAVAQVDIVTLTGVSGTANMTGVGGLTKLITFTTSLKVTADNFVTDNAAAYDAVGITVTAGATDTLIFTAKVAGTALVTAVVTNVTTDLAGTTATSVANVTAIAMVETISVTGTEGYAVVAAAGGLTKYIDFATSIAASIDAFITANAALYTAQGITLSRTSNTLLMTAAVAGTAFTAPTITNVLALSATIAHTTANIVAVRQIEAILISGAFGQAIIAGAGGLSLVLTFDTNLIKTLANFVTANTSAYNAQGIFISSAGNQLSFVANVTGTGFTSPTITTQPNLSGAIAHTTANVSLSALNFAGASKQKGIGGKLLMIKAATNMTVLASATLRLWFFSKEPSLTVGDNIAYINNYANAEASDFYLDVVFDALLAGSDMVYGKIQPSPAIPYSAEDKNLYCLIQTIAAITTPPSGGLIMLNAYFER